MGVMLIPIVIGALGKVPKAWKRVWNVWKSEAESRSSKLQHCWNRPKYREESWRLAVTQTSVKDHQLTPVWITLKERNYNCNDNHHHHHHHNVVPLARISLTLSRHFSLSFITSGRSSGLHFVSSHSCWMYVRAGRPAFARPYEGVHRSTSFMSSSLLLQQ